MAPYPAYRPSGVAWLGDVPGHWDVSRLKWSRAGIVNGVWGEDPDGENDIPCVRVADFDRQQFRVNFSEPTERAISRSQRSGRELRVGDLLLEKSGGGEKQMVGCVVLFDHEEAAVCSNFISRVQVSLGQDSRFWTYVHAALYFGKLNYPAIKQTTGIQNLDADAYFDTSVAFPPLDEQRAIAAFLDRETERIDALVAKKRQLIERLQEYRIALITRTVTRGLPSDAARAVGLDPSPRLKPSGGEWLGDMPEHWEARRLEHVAAYRTSNVDKKTEDGELPVRLCNYTDVYYGERIRADEGDFMKATASPREIARFRLVRGDVVVTKDSEDWRDIAVPALIEETAGDFVCGYHLGLIRPSSSLEPAFLFRVMQSMVVNQQLQTYTSGVTRYGLPNSAVGETVIPVPPLSEQRAIGVFLDAQTEALDEMRGQAESAIDRLQEYRTALITAAVTGKIDVRE